MPVSMLVKCENCGYENFPQHRFCGMCAAELRLPGPAGTQPGPPPAPMPAPAPRRVPAPTVTPPRVKDAAEPPVSGPSFLGLGNEPTETRSVSYLLEDEPASHRGKYVFSLLLLLVALAIVGWHWREDIVSRLSLILGGKAQTNSSASAGPQTTSEPLPGAPVEPANSGPGQPDTQPPAAQGASPSASPATAGTNSIQPPQADQSQAPDQSQRDSSAVTKSDDSGDQATPPAPAHKVTRAQAQPATPSATQSAALEAEGEKYLYGNGVPENCARARTNLLAAAEHSNAQAQNVLGTMYATGHCATRDLPTAYRWFSRSLRKDPNNTRIEQDLKVLWNQMTPEERQLALKNER